MLSFALTLNLLADLGPLPMRATSGVLAEARHSLGFKISQKMVELHLKHAMRTGLAEVITVDGEPCYRITEAGKEFLRKTLGERKFIVSEPSV